MRVLSRAAALTAGALTMTALAVAPASATPEDGKGCAGIKEIPAAYVCVISATPQNALPGTTTTSIPVTTPTICYVADCLAATTVHVPVPGAVPGSGAIAVLWYGGVYYPIAVGTVPGVPTVPTLPSVPSIPTVPSVPSVPSVPPTPGLLTIQDVVDLASPWVPGDAEWVVDFARHAVDSPGDATGSVVDPILGEGTWEAVRSLVYYCYRYPRNCGQ